MILAHNNHPIYKKRRNIIRGAISMNYLFDGISLQNKRYINMDSLLLTRRYINGKDVLLAVVCDGIGGFADGAYASGLAVKMLNTWFNELIYTERIGINMRETVLNINTHIVLDAKHKNINTGSTLSALLIMDDIYYIVHIGDSRIYSYEDGTLSLITNDNVSATGKLTACIGQIENIVLQYYEGIVANKIFLLCTDGLYKRMDVDLVINKIEKVDKRTLKGTIKILTEHVIENGEQDNISVVLVKIKN